MWGWCSSPVTERPLKLLGRRVRIPGGGGGDASYEGVVTHSGTGWLAWESANDPAALVGRRIRIAGFAASPPPPPAPAGDQSPPPPREGVVLSRGWRPFGAAGFVVQLDPPVDAPGAEPPAPLKLQLLGPKGAALLDFEVLAEGADLHTIEFDEAGAPPRTFQLSAALGGVVFELWARRGPGRVPPPQPAVDAVGLLRWARGAGLPLLEAVVGFGRIIILDTR
jgi:hypothetical protein